MARLSDRAEVKPDISEKTEAVSAADALRAATLGGARAVGLAEHIGSLQAGKQADFTIVRLDQAHQQPAFSPADTLIFASSGRDVVLTVVEGQEVFRDGRLLTTDESEWQVKLESVRRKLDAIG